MLREQINSLDTKNVAIHNQLTFLEGANKYASGLIDKT